ncbi:MAG: carbamoyltransferase [Chitinophagales bacterium]|nr:carbamoyltransferase [Chitinophagales bacterium]
MNNVFLTQLLATVKILGISCFYHDAAAAMVVDGEIVAAAQEERFTRKKHDPDFPANAIHYCLRYAGCSLNDLDAIVFYDKPFLKFERLLETYYAFAPKGFASFLKAMPVWLKEKLFLKKLLYDELGKIGPFDKKKTKLLFPEHHLSHAASAFYPSPFEEAAILTIDGVGEWATASICMGRGASIEILKQLEFPHSVGLLYSAFTYFLGFKVNSGEYKLMGLAPYGNAKSDTVAQYRQVIKEHLVTIHDDGSIWLNQAYFTYATGLRMVPDERWEQLFGMPKRKEGDELEQRHCDLALAIQQVTEEIVLKMAQAAKQLTGAAHLCMAGGVALNCVANGVISEHGIFDEMYIQPASGDAGGAVGAALAAYHLYFQQPKTNSKKDGMSGSFLGPQYSDLDIELDLKPFSAAYQPFGDFEDLCTEVATLIAEGNVVGWFQGRMEFGPRALGNRSILGDARNTEMQKKLNLKIKYREGFRPFAPAVLEEDAEAYFQLQQPSPYMLLVAPVQENLRNDLPSNYAELPLVEKLYTQRSRLPAVTHVDFSARVQTVQAATNHRFHQLLMAFKQLTGDSVLINTSFNVRGEPPVCTPADAYRCFMRTEMDYLVLGNYLLDKRQQPPWPEAQEQWQQNFVLD